MFADFFPVLLALFAVGFFLPVFTPGVSGARRWGYMGIQLVLAVLALALGWTVIGPAVWEAGGGCAGHGGNFEGACGLTGVVDLVFAALFTAGTVTTASGLAFLLRGVWVQKHTNPSPDTPGAAPSAQRGER